MPSRLTTSTTVRLPDPAGGVFDYVIGTQGGSSIRLDDEGPPPTSRRAFAAAHVVAASGTTGAPRSSSPIDWEATLAFRRHLWRHGLGVADAMDTAQRGMGLNWPATAELIARTAVEARAVGGELVVGVGTDHLGGSALTLDAVAEAYLLQLGVALDARATPVLMASRELAAVASGPDDYEHVYGAVLSQVGGPILLHWLGGAFDPLLEGYWGSDDLEQAMTTCLRILKAHAGKVEGIKLSLLDADRERYMRAQLPADIRMYTGDDFHYVELIRGDLTGHSDALLGVFDAIAPAAGTALRALDAGDFARYEAVLARTVPLARHLFSAPTPLYKVGIVFLAYVTGHQAHFRMVGGLHRTRPPTYLARLLVLADAAGLIPDPELTAARVRAWLLTSGERG